MTNLGSLGLILLLFFIGMEISLPRLITNWRVSLIGTSIQVLVTILAVFVAGMLVSSSKSTEWVFKGLLSFKVLFVALFFVSIGMLIDLNFIKTNFHSIILMIILIFTINNIINTLVLKAFGLSWGESIYGGAFLAQIGEFSFILGSAGLLSGIIGQFSYDLIINVIAISLILSTFWIYFIQTILKNRIRLGQKT